MKRLTIGLGLFLSVMVAQAQPRAIGARLGYSMEVSYQHSIGNGMIELDAGFPYFSSFQVVGTYNWLIPISSWQHAGSWNLYAGVGIGVGIGWHFWNALFYDVYIHSRYLTKSYGILGIAGMFGAEYNFKFPLQVFADYRPIIGVCMSRHDTWFHKRGLFQVAVGARYRLDFKK